MLSHWAKNVLKKLPIVHDRKINSFIGLEFSADYIKVLKVNLTNNQYEVTCFGVFPLPEGVIVKNEIKDPGAITAILTENFQKLDLTTYGIAIAIPRSSAIIKDLLIDKRLNADEIESRVWIEADRLFPNLIKEIHLDFLVMGPSAVDPSQLEVSLIACRNDQIIPYVAIMERAELHVDIVDVNSYAFERALNIIIQTTCPDLKTVALVNISFSLITLIVMSEGKLVYTYEVSYDGQNIKRSIPPDNQVKDETTANNEPVKLPAASTEVLKNTISSHLRHTMQFFYSSRPHLRLDQLILSGDCVIQIPDLVDWIQKETGKRTILANPFTGMKVAANINAAELNKFAPALMLCCGLSLSTMK